MTTTTTSTVLEPTTQPTRWTLDASHSHVGFSVRHLMISNVRGEFQKVSGEGTFDPKHPESGKVEIQIEVGSIHSRDEKRDAHLLSADFFDAERFPLITFASRRVRRAGGGLEVVGDLTVRDVTREVVLTVDEVTPERADPWGNRRVGATARTKISRADFGMTWNAALEAGGFVVGDEVSIQLEVELIRQT